MEEEIDLGVLNEFGDALDQFQWDGPEDSDEEIADMVPLKEQWEIDEGVKFSKRGLIEYITKKLETESPNNKDDPATAKKWERHLKIPGLNYYLKDGGSEVSKTQPFFRCDVEFKKVYKMHKVIKTLYSPEQQKIHDTQLIDAEWKPIHEGKKTYGYTYARNKKHLNIQSRDFYEKGFNFVHDGKFYRYSTTVANSDTLKPIPDETIRGETIYNLGIMWRDDKGKI